MEFNCGAAIFDKAMQNRMESDFGAAIFDDTIQDERAARAGFLRGARGLARGARGRTSGAREMNARRSV